jgi:hypothetical protein
VPAIGREVAFGPKGDIGRWLADRRLSRAPRLAPSIAPARRLLRPLLHQRRVVPIVNAALREAGFRVDHDGL